MGVRVQIPWKRLRDLESQIDEFAAPRNMRIIFREAYKDKDGNVCTGNSLEVGGVWDNIKNRYITAQEIDNLDDKQKESLERQRTPVRLLSPPQWKFMLHCLEGAMNRYREVYHHEETVQVVLLHGARRGGKSVALWSAVHLVALAKPGATIYIVGLRVKHGRKIINRVMRSLPRNTWSWDNHTSTLRLVNGAVIESKSHVNANADVGDELDLLAIDEAAIMSKTPFDKLSPSCSNRDGFTAMASSPREHNWFYEMAEVADSDDAAAAASVRVVEMSPYDNIFAPSVAKRAEKAKHLMSEEEWLQEYMGKFIAKGGLVLPGFHKTKSVRDPDEMVGDTTHQVAHWMWRSNPGVRWIASVDYNINPTCGVILKTDGEGQIWIVDEVITPDGTEAWGELLEEHLRDLGADDPFMQCLIVGDASGWYQDPRDKKTKKHTSALLLQGQGWRLEYPQRRAKKNPGRHNRMQVMRSLTLNAAGERRFFVAPHCTMTIRALRTIPLNNKGHHDISHPMAHYYDAASYAPYRIWGDVYAKKTIGQRVFKKNLVLSRRQEIDVETSARLDTRSKNR